MPAVIMVHQGCSESGSCGTSTWIHQCIRAGGGEAGWGPTDGAEVAAAVKATVMVVATVAMAMVATRDVAEAMVVAMKVALIAAHAKV